MFSLKRNKSYLHDITFNGNLIEKSSYQEHLGMFLESNLAFEEHNKGIFDKIRKSIGIILSSEIFYLRCLFYKFIN